MIIIKLLTIASVLMLFSNCNENNLENDSKNDLEEENLKGRVRSVVEKSYDAEEKFGEAIKTELYQQKDYYFNEQGDFTEERHRLSRSNPDYFSYGETIFQYDQQGNIIEKKSEWISSGFFGEIKHKYTYKYDNIGNKMEENYYNSEGELSSKEVYKYDGRGNKMEKNWYNSKGELKSKYTYKYDGKGNKTEENSYNSERKLSSKKVCKYDSKGNKTEEIEYNSEGKIEEKYVYVYDKKGNEIESNKYGADGKLEYKYISRYDSKGNKAEEIKYNSDNTISNERAYKYDKRGNMIEVYGKGYYSNGKLKYSDLTKYDEKGNTILSESTEIKEVPENKGLYYNPLVSLEEQEVIYVYHDTETEKKSYVYDENNNIIEECFYTNYLLGSEIMNEDGFSVSYIYQFDNKENWIIRKTLEKGNISTIIEREIEYY